MRRCCPHGREESRRPARKMNGLSKLVESAEIPHSIVLMDDPTPILPLKPQKRFFGSGNSAGSVNPLSGPQELGETASDHSATENGEDKISAQSLIRPPLIPKKFSGSFSANSFDATDTVPTHGDTRSSRQGRGRQNSKKTPPFKNLFFDFKRKISLGLALGAGFALACLSGVLFFTLGQKSSRVMEDIEMPRAQLEITPEVQQLLDQVFMDLKDRKGHQALEKIDNLRTLAPNLTSTSILAANAALLENDLEKVESESQDALLKKELESDAFMLQALAILSQIKDKSFKSIGNPKVRVESLLRQAISANPLNPEPYILLAAVKRSALESREALGLLHSSRLRQSAATDTIVTDAAISLLELDMMLDADLPTLSEKIEVGALNQITTAYTAMRLGKTEVAVSNLTRAKESLPSKVFSQILADPAFRDYSKNPEFGEFFQKQ